MQKLKELESEIRRWSEVRNRPSSLTLRAWADALKALRER